MIMKYTDVLYTVYSDPFVQYQPKNEAITCHI